MATTIYRNETVHTADELPTTGSPLPPFTVTLAGLSDLPSDEMAGSRLD